MTRKDVHPKYDYELFRRPLIVHILQGENLQRKTRLLEILKVNDIKVGEYDKYVVKVESERESEHGR